MSQCQNCCGSFSIIPFPCFTSLNKITGKVLLFFGIVSLRTKLMLVFIWNNIYWTKPLCVVWIWFLKTKKLACLLYFSRRCSSFKTTQTGQSIFKLKTQLEFCHTVTTVTHPKTTAFIVFIWMIYNTFNAISLLQITEQFGCCFTRF